MDAVLLDALNGAARAPIVAELARLASSPWSLLVVGLPVLALLARRRAWVAALALGLALGVSDLGASRVLKPAFDRERPCRARALAVVVAPCGPGRSFPSSHASNAAAFVAAVAPELGRFAPAVGLVALGVSASRIVLGAHYPSDVVGGWAWGIVAGLGARAVARRIGRALARARAARGRLRDPAPSPRPPRRPS
jgi:membrane-associated phospholipid phosphatase